MFFFLYPLWQIIISTSVTDGCKFTLAQESSARAAKFYFLTYYDARCPLFFFSCFGGGRCRTDCTNLDCLFEQHSFYKVTSLYSLVLHTLQCRADFLHSFCGMNTIPDLQLSFYVMSKSAVICCPNKSGTPQKTIAELL